MKKYDSNIDSGIEWIGEIPDHWEAKRIKLFSPVKRGASPRPIDDPKYFDENGEYAWVRIADVTASDRYLTSTTQKLSELGASLSVKRDTGDFFLSIAGSVGKPMITKIKCCIHDGFVYFPQLTINPEFLYYIFQTGLPYLGLGKLGTQLNLNTETVGNIFIPKPPDNEIIIITNYLDKKTTQIDSLISKKEHFISLLQEERTAVISKAVTRGLDPKVKMKDSGIEWLGEIPQHWGESRIKNVANIIGRIGFRGYTTDDLVSKGQGAISLSPSNIKNHILNIDDCTYLSWEKYNESPEIKIFENDIILVKTGSTIGKTSIIPSGTPEMTLNPQLVVFKDIKLNPLFLYYMMVSNYFQGYFSIYTAGGSTPAISQEKINNFRITFPESEEQIKISNFIAKKEIEIKSIISKTQQEIELLKEYKTALISEVVTGKIDVRDKN